MCSRLVDPTHFIIHVGWKWMPDGPADQPLLRLSPIKIIIGNPKHAETLTCFGPTKGGSNIRPSQEVTIEGPSPSQISNTSDSSLLALVFLLHQHSGLQLFSSSHGMYVCVCIRSLGNSHWYSSTCTSVSALPGIQRVLRCKPKNQETSEDPQPA